MEEHVFTDPITNQKIRTSSPSSFIKKDYLTYSCESLRKYIETSGMLTWPHSSSREISNKELRHIFRDAPAVPARESLESLQQEQSLQASLASYYEQETLAIVGRITRLLECSLVDLEELQLLHEELTLFLLNTADLPQEYFIQLQELICKFVNEREERSLHPDLLQQLLDISSKTISIILISL